MMGKIESQSEMLAVVREAAGWLPTVGIRWWVGMDTETLAASCAALSNDSDTHEAQWASQVLADSGMVVSAQRIRVGQDMLGGDAQGRRESRVRPSRAKVQEVSAGRLPRRIECSRLIVSYGHASKG